jgi:8-oxo-dGTP pyrophosphatase MutT (NUDIX family)
LAVGSAEIVRAAGGVIWRPGPQGAEVIVVHRPRYDDWSLPKGKLQAGERIADAALREVQEETGLRCRLGQPLLTTRYVDPYGRDKIVWYFAMEPIEGAFQPNKEIDQLRWLPLADALEALTHDHDRMVVEALAATGLQH